MTRNVAISFELRPEDDGFTGCATTADGWQREFSGWLGLMSAIDALLFEDATDRKDPT